MKYSERELLVLWLDSFSEIEYSKKRLVYGLLQDKTGLKRAIERNKAVIVKACGDAGYNALYSSADKDYLCETLKKMEQAGETAITFQSEKYPERLKNIPDPPLALYMKGNAELLNSKIFGIVGSRTGTAQSFALAAKFADELSAAGLTVATGTAEGADAEALAAALKNGRAIAVSAGGLNNIYPASNRDLAEKAAEHGLIISERREDIKPMPYFFPIRNRIIAGLAEGTLVVSGRLKSGTLYTANYCIDYGRDLFAVPYSPGIESGEGPNSLIKSGAYLADSPKDILDFYGLEKDQKETPFSDEEREIVSALKEGALHIEKIAEKTGRQVFEITSALTVLEIKGAVYKEGINTYGLVRNSEA